MNNKQFITELAQRLGYTAQDTQKMVYQVVDAMADSFQEGNTIAVQNFGSFEVKKKIISMQQDILFRHWMLIVKCTILSWTQ